MNVLPFLQDSQKSCSLCEIRFSFVRLNSLKEALSVGTFSPDSLVRGTQSQVTLERVEGWPLPATAVQSRSHEERLRMVPGPRQRASVGKISAKCCSFSAVSAPIFATKYAFCSIFQNLPDSQAEIFEI